MMQEVNAILRQRKSDPQVHFIFLNAAGESFMACDAGPKSQHAVSLQISLVSCDRCLDYYERRREEFTLVHYLLDHNLEEGPSRADLVFPNS